MCILYVIYKPTLYQMSSSLECHQPWKMVQWKYRAGVQSIHQIWRSETKQGLSLTAQAVGLQSFCRCITPWMVMMMMMMMIMMDDDKVLSFYNNNKNMKEITIFTPGQIYIHYEKQKTQWQPERYFWERWNQTLDSPFPRQSAFCSEVYHLDLRC